jgi:hypothetical protein
MTNFKKRRSSNGEVDDDVTEESSYCKVKARLKKKEAELEQVCVRLQCTEQRIKEVETHFEQAIKVLQDTLRQKEDLALELTVVRSELDHEINVNENIVNGINKENRRLKSSMGMLRLRIERLTTSVVVAVMLTTAWPQKYLLWRRRLKQWRMRRQNITLK